MLPAEGEGRHWPAGRTMVCQAGVSALPLLPVGGPGEGGPESQRHLSQTTLSSTALAVVQDAACSQWTYLCRSEDKPRRTKATRNAGCIMYSCTSCIHVLHHLSSPAAAFWPSLPPVQILLLDEATSALDAGSEREVQAALDVIMQGPTSVVIAHMLSTVRAVDVICVVQGGAVVEAGRHEELMGITGGSYAQLVQAQQSSKVVY
jgi:hypothetical protein